MAKHFYRCIASVDRPELTGSVSLKEYFMRHKNFMLLVIGHSGIMASTMIVTESFLPQVVYANGGSNFDLGLIPGLKAVVEVPFIFYFARLEERFGLKKIFIIAMISFVLKMYLFYSANTMFWLYVSQLLQATSFSLILPGMVSYVNRIMHKNELQRSHGLMMITRTLFSMFISPIGGSVIENSGSKQFCFMGFVICSISAAIFMLGLAMDKNRTGETQ